MHWVNATWIRCGTKPPGHCGRFLFVQSDYLFEHTFCFFVSDLFTQKYGCCSLSSFSFFFLPSSCFPVFLFSLSFCCQAVPQFSKLWIIYRGCSEFLDPCVFSLYHHIFSEVYQCSLLRPDLCNMIINDLIKPDWEVPVNIPKGRAAREIHQDRLVEWADRSLMKWGPDRQQAAQEPCSTEGKHLLDCVNRGTDSKLGEVTFSPYSALIRPHLGTATHFGIPVQESNWQTGASLAGPLPWSGVEARALWGEAVGARLVQLVDETDVGGPYRRPQHL